VHIERAAIARIYNEYRHKTRPTRKRQYYPMNLTLMDVKKLTEEPSPKVRGMLAAKIAVDYQAGNFSEAEAHIAADIFRILLKDAERKIRRTLAEHLSRSPNVPHDIVWKLAHDDPEVAAPVLQYSHALTEADLVAIIKSTREVLKLCAIAKRDTLSEQVSDSLIETHNEQVLQDLFQNKGAKIAERSLVESWKYISSNRSFLETLVHRGALPLTIAEKIYNLVSDDLKHQLVRQYKLNAPVAQKTTHDAREWEMLGIIPGEGRLDPTNDEHVEDLIDQLYLGGRLTHSFLIRALCIGSLSVFEAGIARLAGVPRVNARILLMDSGSLGFGAIYKASHMPEGFYDAIRVLLKISLEETEFGRNKRNDFRRRVIDRIYIENHHRTVENMEYLLSIIGGRIAATVH
jgi:uncharacterized protein (DUF2336 family)